MRVVFEFLFEVDPDDYIVYVEGYHEKVSGGTTEIITALLFRTYKGKTSQQFGIKSGTKFVLQGGKVFVFHGRSIGRCSTLTRGLYYFAINSKTAWEVDEGSNLLDQQNKMNVNTYKPT